MRSEQITGLSAESIAVSMMEAMGSLVFLSANR
jgi:hypothetical protein